MNDEKDNLRGSLPATSKNKFINLLFLNAEVQETTFKKVIIFYLLIGLIFLGFSIALFVVLSRVKEFSFLYYQPSNPNNSEQCPSYSLSQKYCKVTFTLDEAIQQQILVMYQLGNFYQNHRRYIQSKSNYQLAGNVISNQQAMICMPYVTNDQMGKTVSWGNPPVQLHPNAIASPCGAIGTIFYILAKTFFNDTYAIENQNSQSITIDEKGISWPGDQGSKYRKSGNSSMTQWIDPQDQHFIVWMRTAGLPNFRKLWGRIPNGLQAGNYTFLIKNNYNSSNWQGKRSIILTTNSIFGGKNLIMPIFFLVLSIGCFIACLFFRAKWISRKKHSE